MPAQIISGIAGACTFVFIIFSICQECLKSENRTCTNMIIATVVVAIIEQIPNSLIAVALFLYCFYGEFSTGMTITALIFAVSNIDFLRKKIKLIE